MFGALLSVLSVVVISIGATYWMLSQEEPIFKSDHHVPTLLSAYNDKDVMNVIEAKKALASRFRSEDMINLDDQSQVDGLRSGVLKIKLDGKDKAYLKGLQATDGFSWLIDDRSCKQQLEIKSMLTTSEAPERLIRLTPVAAGECRFGIVYTEEWKAGTFAEYEGDDAIQISVKVEE